MDGEPPEKRLPKNGNLFSRVGKEGIGMRNYKPPA
jgi:hypothetical protein